MSFSGSSASPGAGARRLGTRRAKVVLAILAAVLLVAPAALLWPHDAARPDPARYERAAASATGRLEFEGASATPWTDEQALYGVLPADVIGPALQLLAAAEGRDGADPAADAQALLRILGDARGGWARHAAAWEALVWPEAPFLDPWAPAGRPLAPYLDELAAARGAARPAPIESSDAHAAFLALYAAHGDTPTPAQLAELDARLAALDPLARQETARLVVALASATTLVQAAFADLDDGELALVEGHPYALLPEVPGTPAPGSRARSADGAVQLAVAKVHLDPLLQAASTLAWASAAAAPRLDASPDAAFVDPLGLVEVAGRGVDKHSQSRLLVVDLGGSDSYLPSATAAAANLRQGRPAVLVLDLGGNDQYVGNGAQLAGAVLGVAGLLDVAGDDQYTLDGPGAFGRLDPAFGLAGAYLGAAWLDDRAGDDTYVTSSAGALGAALGGLALLHDATGNDRYTTTGTASGQAPLGNLGSAALGVAAVWDDSGDDATTASWGGPGAPGFGGFAYYLDNGGHDTHTASVGPSLPGTGDFQSPAIVQTPLRTTYAVGERLPPLGSGFAADNEQPVLPELETGDADGDQFPDGVEKFFGSDPDDADSTPPGTFSPPGTTFPIRVGNLITLGSINSDTYSPAFVAPRLVLDPFGGDRYQYAAASSSDVHQPAIVLDLQGADQYGGNTGSGPNQAFGYGANGGAGILYDAASSAVLNVNTFRAGPKSLGYGEGTGLGLFITDASPKYDDATSGGNNYVTASRRTSGYDLPSGGRIGGSDRGSERLWVDGTFGLGADSALWFEVLPDNLLDPNAYVAYGQRTLDLRLAVSSPSPALGGTPDDPLRLAPGNDLAFASTIFYAGQTPIGHDTPTTGAQLVHSVGIDGDAAAQVSASEPASMEPRQTRAYQTVLASASLPEGTVVESVLTAGWGTPALSAAEAKTTDNEVQRMVRIEAVHGAQFGNLVSPSGAPRIVAPGVDALVNLEVRTDGNVPITGVAVSLSIRRLSTNETTTLPDALVDLQPAGPLDSSTPGPAAIATFVWPVADEAAQYDLTFSIPGTATRSGLPMSAGPVRVLTQTLRQLQVERLGTALMASGDVQVPFRVQNLGNVQTPYALLFSALPQSGGEAFTANIPGTITQGETQTVNVPWSATPGRHTLTASLVYSSSIGVPPASVSYTVQAIPGLVYGTDAESGTDGWVPGGDAVNGFWARSTSSTVGAPVIAGNRNWDLVMAQWFQRSTHQYLLTSPPIDLTGTDNAVLTFQHKHSQVFEFPDGTPYLGGQVQASTNAGQSWETIEPVGGYPCAAIEALDGAPGFCADATTAHVATFDLNPFTGRVLQLRFFVKEHPNQIFPDFRWSIDNIFVTGIPRLDRDLHIDGITVPPAFVEGEPLEVQVRVRNGGLTDAVAPLTVGIGRAGQPPLDQATRQVTLAPGQAREETFTFTAPAPGYYRLQADLPLADDPRPADNSQTQTLVANVVARLDDFEAAEDEGWTHSGTNDDWQHGTPGAGGGPGAAHSGTRVWGTGVTSGAYRDNANADLVSPAIPLPCAGELCRNVVVELWHWYNFEPCCDEATVAFQVNDGAWVEAGSFTGVNSGWQRLEYHPLDGVDVPADSTLRARFHYNTDTSVTNPGWYLDDFVVRAPPQAANDLAATFAFEPGSLADVRDLLDVPVRIVNTGTNAMPGGQVTVTSPEDPDLNAVLPYPALAGGEQHVATLAYVPPGTGLQHFTAQLAVVDDILDDDQGHGEVRIAWVVQDPDFDTDPFFTPDDTAVSSWEFGAPSAGPTGARTGSNVWATDLDGDYPPSLNQALTSPEVTLPAFLIEPRFSFAVWHVALGGDGLFAEVRTAEPGQTPGPWQSRTFLETSSTRLGGDSNGWVERSIALDAFTGSTIQVRLRAASNGFGQGPGWAIDDVAVHARVPTVDVSVRIVAPMAERVGPGQPVLLSALVSNNAVRPARGATITLALLEDEHSVTVEELAPFESRYVNVTATVNAGEGDMGELRFAASIPGDQRPQDNVDARVVTAVTVYDLMAGLRATPLATLQPDVPVHIEAVAVNNGTMPDAGVLRVRVTPVDGGPSEVTPFDLPTLIQGQREVYTVDFTPPQAGRYDIEVDIEADAEDVLANNVALTRVFLAVPADRFLADFDAGPQGWSAFRYDGVTGFWTLGKPTYEDALRGNGSLATTLDGQLGHGEEYLAQSPPLDLRGGAASLTFIQRYTTGSGSGGVVEGSLDRGQSWQPLLPTGGYPAANVAALGTPGFEGTDGGPDGQQVTFDLSGYEVRDFQFRLRYATADEGALGPGWRIDDLLVTASSQKLLEQDFELFYQNTFETNSDWSPELPGGAIWERGTPVNGPAAAFQGDAVWATDLDGVYGDNLRAVLNGPVLRLPPATANNFAQFYIWYESEGFWDCLKLQVRPTSGSAWQTLDPVGGYPSGCSSDGGRGYAGSSNGWERARFDLAPIAGQEVQFRMQATSDTSVSGLAGWYVDDFKIGPLSLLDTVGTGAGLLEATARADAIDFEWGSIESGPSYDGSLQGWATNLDGKYRPLSDEEWVSPPLSLAGVRSPVLHLSPWVQTFDDEDTGRLEISVDGGPWTLLRVLQGQESRYIPVQAALPAGAESIRVRILFESDDEAEVDGLYLLGASISSSRATLNGLPAVPQEITDGTMFTVSGQFTNQGPHLERYTITASVPDPRWVAFDQDVVAAPGQTVPFTLPVQTSYGGVAGPQALNVQAVSLADPIAMVERLVPLNLTIIPKPDLVIPAASQAIQFDPVYHLGGERFIFAGDEVQLSVTTGNIGNADYHGGAVLNLFELGGGGLRVSLASVPVPPIPAGDPYIVVVPWIPTHGGQHRLQVEVNPQQLVPELRFDNNARTVDVLVRERPRPDYEVQGLSLDRAVAQVGDQVLVLAEVYNQGLDSSTLPVPVEFLVDSPEPTVQSPARILPAGSLLAWTQSVSLEDRVDGVVVEVRQGEGPWTLVIPDQGYTSINVASLSGPGFTGRQELPAAYTARLPGGALPVQVRWRLAMDGTTPVLDEPFTGFRLDGVRIVSPQGQVVLEQGFESAADAGAQGWTLGGGAAITGWTTPAPGLGAAQAGYFDADGYGNPGFLRASELRPGPGIGQSQSVAFPWVAQAGTHRLRVQVDPKDVIAERASESNRFDRIVSVDAPSLDLTLTSGQDAAHALDALPGSIVNATAVLHNGGTLPLQVDVRALGLRGWRIDPLTAANQSASSLTLPPASTTGLVLRVQVPADAAAGEVLLPINVTSSSAGPTLDRLLYLNVRALAANATFGQAVGRAHEGVGVALVVLRSTSSQAMRADVVVTDIPTGWIVTPMPGTFDVPAFATRPITVDVRMPADTPAATYPFKLQATLRAQGAEATSTVNLPMALKVDPVPRLGIEVPAEAALPVGAPLPVQVSVRNDGRLATDAHLVVEAPAGVTLTWSDGSTGSRLLTGLVAGSVTTLQGSLTAGDDAIPGDGALHWRLVAGGTTLEEPVTLTTVTVENRAALAFLPGLDNNTLEILSDDARVVVLAHLANLGGADAANVQAVLLADGVEVARRTVAVPAGGVADIEFPGTIPPTTLDLRVRVEGTTAEGHWDGPDLVPLQTAALEAAGSKGLPLPTMLLVCALALALAVARRRQ